MNLKNALPNVTKLLSAIKLAGRRDVRLSRLDFAILEVAMMVAALDGVILSSEVDAFTALAKKCRGYTTVHAKACLDAALRRAGYLMAIATVGGYTEKQRIEAFVALAVEAMPRGFVDGKLSDLRRAFVLWISMGVSDGDFSALERKALDALQDRLAEVMVDRAIDEEQRWIAFSPTYRLAGGKPGNVRKITLLEPDFTERAVQLLGDLSVGSRREKAELALVAFIDRD